MNEAQRMKKLDWIILKMPEIHEKENCRWKITKKIDVEIEVAFELEKLKEFN